VVLSRGRTTGIEATMRKRVCKDLFALLSGIVWVVFLGSSVYVHLHKEVLLSGGMFHHRMVVLTGAHLATALPMWGWMIIDCAGEIGRSRNTRLIGWLLVILLLYPAAWFYYVLEKRNRDRHPSRTHPSHHQ